MREDIEAMQDMVMKGLKELIFTTYTNKCTFPFGGLIIETSKLNMFGLE